MDHTIVHFEIPANDVEKLSAFYNGVFGWEIEKLAGPMEYYSIVTVPIDEKGMPKRQGVNGGMLKKQLPEHKPVNYFSVESVDAFIKKILALGGQVVVPKTEILEVGWFALAVDPEGNQFGLLEPLEK